MGTGESKGERSGSRVGGVSGHRGPLFGMQTCHGPTPFAKWLMSSNIFVVHHVCVTFGMWTSWTPFWMAVWRWNRYVFASRVPLDLRCLLSLVREILVVVELPFPSPVSHSHPCSVRRGTVDHRLQSEPRGEGRRRRRLLSGGGFAGAYRMESLHFLLSLL